jgi:D-proline reductase (dithiol) PrdB
MIIFNRFKNRLIASVLTRFPSLADRVAKGIDPLKFDTTPWAPVTKPLAQMTVALITTAGVHLKTDAPFDMSNKSGDGSFRVIHSGVTMGDLAITHDYYDHTDADRDVNIVFPLERLRELVANGVIGAVAKRHYGFMGHIENEQIEKLTLQSAPEVARLLKEDRVDAILITPG